MHREQILGLINTYRQRFPDESIVADEMCRFIQDNPECFSRELEIGHITGSAWILNPLGTSVLLTNHKKLNIWVQLGGHADGESDIGRVAQREAEEESGLKTIRFLLDEIFDLDIHEIPARGSEPAHLHYDCRFVMQAYDEEYIISEESHDLAWIPLVDIEKTTMEASILRMANKTRDIALPKLT